jgi:hypothetical protein
MFPHLFFRCAILLLFLVVVAHAKAGRLKVAILDGMPVYHWTIFKSVYTDDIDRALILRDFHRQGLTLPDHFVDEAIQNTVRKDFGGDQGALIKALKRDNETLAHFRQFTSEEIILRAMRKHETEKKGTNGVSQTEAEWLASLRKGARIQLLANTSNQR